MGIPSDQVILAAQAHTVAYLHHTLPYFPVAWIVNVLSDSEFLAFYYRKRRRNNVLKIVFAWMVVACAPEFYLSLITLEAHDTGEYAWLLSWEVNVMIFVSCFVMALLMKLLCRCSKRFERQVLIYGKLQLPKIFYNGLWRDCGRIPGTFARARQMVENPADLEAWASEAKARGARGRFPCLHDGFDTVTLVVCISASHVALVCSLGVCGFSVQRWKGLALGMTSGSAIGSLLLWPLNWLMGPGSDLTNAIEGMLRDFQPQRKVLFQDNQVRANRISEAKDAAVAILRDQFLHSEPPLSQKEAIGVDELIGRIQEDGSRTVEKILHWLLDRPSQLHYAQGLCWRLFSTAHPISNVFSTTQYNLAILSCLDLPTFLLYAFDPDWEVLRLRWRPKTLLRSIFVTAPRQMFFAKDRREPWKWKTAAKVRSKPESDSGDLFVTLRVDQTTDLFASVSAPRRPRPEPQTATGDALEPLLSSMRPGN